MHRRGSQRKQIFLAGSVCVVAAIALAPAAPPEPGFIPDVTFKGSSLKGWHVLGQASWGTQNGELVGKATGESGGWLMLDRSLQDTGLFTSFRRQGDSSAGLLFRAEKTPDGYKGIFVLLTEPKPEIYRVTLNMQGRELQRERIRPGGGMARIAPPPKPPAAPGASAASTAQRPANPTPPLPLTPPQTDLLPGEWNQIEVVLDANIIRVYTNGGADSLGHVAEEEYGRFGPVALFVGGRGEVRFKDVGYKDLAVKVTPAETVSPRFRMQRISDMYYSWSSAAADFNRDGSVDVVAGPYIYFGPDYTKYREIFYASTVNPSTGFPNVNCQFAYDFNGDGWPDILVGPPRATLFLNPKGESRRWDRYDVITSVQSEVALLQDVNGNGTPDLIYSGDGFQRYATFDPADPTKPWTVHSVSEKGYGVAHGAGAGDINGDGRQDLVNPYGWWEQPPAGSGQRPWTYHPVAFARYSRGAFGGAGMFIYDVNGDGLKDVVTSLAAHTFGIGWYEQKRDAAGNISFVEHVFIDGFRSTKPAGAAFSQPHGTALADIDRDGIPDFLVGKRHWSHIDTYLDPDPNGPAVLYWFRTVRNPKAPGGAEFVPELIHNRSGVGSDILASDLNKDGWVDIVTSANRGTFIFWGGQRPERSTRAGIRDVQVRTAKKQQGQ